MVAIICVYYVNDLSALTEEPTGICVPFDANEKTNFANFGLAELAVDFLILIPVLSFFALDRPHDCYTCLGKDPDRIYSSFQLTFEERARRQAIAKYGPKEVKQMKEDSVYRHLLVKRST